MREIWRILVTGVEEWAQSEVDPNNNPVWFDIGLGLVGLK